MTWQCALVAQKSIHILRCIKSSLAKRSKEVILPLYSTLVKPHLECCIELWGPYHRKDMNLLAQVQRKATKTESCSTSTKRELRLFILEKRSLQGGLEALEYFKGAYRN